MPQRFLMGTADQPIPDDEAEGEGGAEATPGAAAGDEPSHDADYEILHALAVRGLLKDLRGADPKPLEDAGLVRATSAGHILTAEGRKVHEELLARERAGLDLEHLAPIYERFLGINRKLKEVSSDWQLATGDAKDELLRKIGDLVQRVEKPLRRTGQVMPRFDGYADRLNEALERAEGGATEWILDPRIDSIHTVWMELHEDYLQVLGRDREAEGSF